MATDAASRDAARGVVVTLDAALECGATLDMAALLAASRGAELEVVFVENANLLRLADLPLAREIDRLSGASRAIDTRSVLRSLAVEARRLRREVTRVANAHAVRARLRIARGEMLAEALRSAESVDATFVHARTRAFPGEAAPGTARTYSAPGVGAARAPRGKRVWSLFDSGPGGARALDTAAKLCTALDCGLTVLIPYRAADEAERHARDVRARVSEAQILLLEMAENRSPFEAGVVRPRSSRLLVMSKPSRWLEEETTRRYLEFMPVPLLLVT